MKRNQNSQKSVPSTDIGSTVVLELYFGLTKEQQKLLNLKGSLARLRLSGSELLEQEHEQDTYQVLAAQYSSLVRAEELISSGDANGGHGLLTSICTGIDSIGKRVTLEELDQRYLESRVDLVIQKVEYHEAVVRQVLLKLQPIIENPSLEAELVALQLVELDAEVKLLASFPTVFLEGFDGESYLAAYPDLVTALSGGMFSAPVVHFVKHGYEEILNGTRLLSGSNPIHSLVFGRNADSNGADSATQGKNNVAASSVPNDGCVQSDTNIVLESDLATPDSLIASLVSELSTDERSIVEDVRDSGIVDSEWYRVRYCQCEDAVAHFLLLGIHEENQPNILFELNWYFAKYLRKSNALTLFNKQVKRAVSFFGPKNRNIESGNEQAVAAFFHYIYHGMRVDLPPSPGFEPEWYRRNFLNAQLGMSPLSHYLTVGQNLGQSPNSVFDPAFYLQDNPDVARENYEPVKHYYTRGFKEDRNPAPGFDSSLYREWYLSGDDTVNTLDHYLEFGRENQFATNKASRSKFLDNHDKKNSLSGNIKKYSNSGSLFEPAEISNSLKDDLDVKCIAFYLPQFHEFEDNNEWWGKGFTEWRNVSRGTPRFKGHYQPRIPRDLGFYNLLNEETIRAQVDLAVSAGLAGFCFYYYWFNGKRLMQDPLDLFANSESIDFPFCIMWANENWTRTWDGHDNDVLIRQDYIESDEDAFIQDTSEYFRNDRYIKVNGRPLFVLYRPGLVTDSTTTIDRWKNKWTEQLGVTPLVYMVQGFGDNDPGIFDLDGAVEFPPHKLLNDVREITHEVEILDPDFSGKVVSYADVVNRSLNEPVPDYPLIRTVSPFWDNDARREGRGLTIHGSTPRQYQQWLSGACQFARNYPTQNESFVFVNAWNEWAESAYLEPDVHYGHAYLNATRRVLTGITDILRTRRIILVGHDANPHGAQMILLGIGRTLKHEYNVHVEFLLKSSGPLVGDYEEVAPVHVLGGMKDEEIAGLISSFGASAALTNTVVCGELVPILKQAGLQVVSLVHELPRIAREYGLIPQAAAIAKCSDSVICPADFVMDGFESYAGTVEGNRVVSPQGLYHKMEFDSGAHLAVREKLGIPAEHKLVMNTGFADLRKGFDTFVKIAEDVIASDDNIHFLWVGEIEPNLRHWILKGLSPKAKHRIHTVGFSDNVGWYCSASDCFLLTSREDPYPTVVLEALAVGCPAIIFEGCTGLEKLVGQFGKVVDPDNQAAVIQALRETINQDTEHARSARREHMHAHYQYEDYCFGLLQYLDPGIKKVSVVIPNFNYEDHIEARILSVLRQTYPIYELIVLDDASSDNSVQVIENLVEREKRRCQFIFNDQGSGNVFRQWNKGLENATGDYIWIAEADDLADPRFLETLINSMADDTTIAFCNSSQIDNEDRLIAPDYNYYYNTIPLLSKNESFSCAGPEFVEQCISTKNTILNVSSVVWKKDALENALASVGESLFEFQVVGDWRLYVEALAQDNSTISYVATPLNTHRRHQSSVTHSLDYTAHLKEVMEMHTHVIDTGLVDDGAEHDMASYVEELKEQFGLEDSPRVDGTSIADQSEAA